MNAPESTSTRPYLLRALHEWCTDNSLTPFIAVRVDDGVQVPREYVQNGEIVLNVSFDATSALQLGNEFIEFKARFGGIPRDIIVPIDRVLAIYARENGQGMAFPPPAAIAGAETPVPAVATPASPAEAARPAPDAAPAIQLVPAPGASTPDSPPPAPPPPAKRKPPSLKRVK